jgi:hypothetical protein
MSKPFIVVRMDSAGSGESYQTVGPWTGGYASFEEADTHARTLNGRYPRARFAVFQRRVVYDTLTSTKRCLDRRSGEQKRGVAEFKQTTKPTRAAG